MCWLRDTLVGVRKAGLALAPFTPGATEPLDPGTCGLSLLAGLDHPYLFGAPLRLVDSLQGPS